MSRDICLRCPETSQNGGGGIRTLVRGKPPETVCETAAFNRSATPPGAIKATTGVPARALAKPDAGDDPQHGCNRHRQHLCDLRSGHRRGAAKPGDQVNALLWRGVGRVM